MNYPFYQESQKIGWIKEIGKSLKNLIGEVTRGGANPGRSHQLNDLFEIFIPDGQSINPHNGSNWEGIGVIPDLFVTANEALDLSLSL